jgi:hypothetical protein
MSAGVDATRYIIAGPGGLAGEGVACGLQCADRFPKMERRPVSESARGARHVPTSPVGIGHKLASWVREKMRDVRLRIGAVGQTIMTEQSNYWNSHLGKIALALLAVALVAILGVYESIPVKQHNAAVASGVPDPTAQAIRDLQTSQQQAIDQLKGLQQTVSSGQAEVRRLSEEVTGLTHKLEALQQSFASAQRAPIVESAEPAKQTQTPDNTDPPLSPSYGAGRVAGAAPFHGLSGATRSRPPHGSPAATRRRAPKFPQPG